MNRPNKNSMKYFMGEHEYFYTEYVYDLENYCNEIEKKNNDSNIAWNDLRHDYLELEKALDKACERIANTQGGGTKEEWRDRFLNGHTQGN